MAGSVIELSSGVTKLRLGLDQEFALHDSRRRLSIRLATTPEERLAAQQLRYEIFYGEAGRTVGDGAPAVDTDRYDALCDHLIVVDEAASRDGLRVIGNYRLLRESVALSGVGFYSASGFDLEPLLHRPGECLELGRSCIHPDYRDGRTISLLWQGIASYVNSHAVGTLFGRASFDGMQTEGREHALAYLHHFRGATGSHRVRAHPDRRIDLDLMPAEEVDTQRAWRELPPLVKGYLRLGASIGDGAAVDEDLNQLDVCIIVQISEIARRYARHFFDPRRSRAARAA